MSTSNNTRKIRRTLVPLTTSPADALAVLRQARHDLGYATALDLVNGAVSREYLDLVRDTLSVITRAERILGNRAAGKPLTRHELRELFAVLDVLDDLDARRERAA